MRWQSLGSFMFEEKMCPVCGSKVALHRYMAEFGNLYYGGLRCKVCGTDIFNHDKKFNFYLIYVALTVALFVSFHLLSKKLQWKEMILFSISLLVLYVVLVFQATPIRARK